jgi:hypothetical protein
MEREIKAGLRRRSSRRVNMMARRNPARAPRNPSVMERLLNVRRPWPVSRNPVYAITTVQTIARTFTGPHIPAGFSKIISAVPPPAHLHYFRSACDGNTGNPVCSRQPKPATRHERWGSKLYPVGRKLVSDRDLFDQLLTFIDVGQGEMMLSAHGAPRPKQASQRATPVRGANVIRKGEFGRKAHHAPTAKSLEWLCR